MNPEERRCKRVRKIRKLTLAQLALLALATVFAVLASPQPAHANEPTCVQECTPGWNGCGSINGFTCYRS